MAGHTGIPVPKPPPFDLTDFVNGLMIDAGNFLTTMVQPWRLIQIGIIIGLFVVAHLVTRYWLDARLRVFVTRLARSRHRLFPLTRAIANRSRGLVFILLAWATVAVMREVTWLSRSYLILLYANLATAWIFVGFVTRLVRNPILSRVLRYGAWIYVTLRLVRLDDRAVEILDAVALDMGEMRVSLWSVLQALAVLAILLFLASWVTSFVHTRIRRVDDLSPSMQVLVEKLVTLAAYSFAAVFAIKSLGFDLSNLAILSGAVGVGIGFGLQKIVSNLVSGFILLLDKSIKPGDVISLGDTFGWIQNLSARYVSVLTRDGREYLIPNEDLITGQVVNWSHSSKFVRLDIRFGVSYDSDPHEVRKLAVAAVAAVDRVEEDPRPVCHVTGFGDSSVDFILRFWIDDPSAGLTNIRGAVFLALWDALKANDIEIPFPRRDVTVLSDTRSG